MAREIDLSKPLTAEDLAYLEARYSSTYIEHAKRVAGVEDGAEDAQSDEEVQAEEAEALRKQAEEAENARLAAEAEAAEAAAAEATQRAQEEAEDLIGSGAADGDFDVLGSTEAEVKTWAASASDEDKAAALEVEQSREDRDPRKGVVSILGG